MKTTNAVIRSIAVPGHMPSATRYHAVVPRFLALGVISLAAVVGCQPSAPYYSVPTAAFSAPQKGTLSNGDVLNLTFPGAPELTQKVKVQPDGKIVLPMVGSVHAAGRSAASLQSSLSSMYQPHLNVPTVFVSVEEAAASVYVTGEVANPGKVPLERPITAFEGVMEVGGFSKFANPKKVYVIRNEHGKQKRYVLSLSDPIKGYETEAFYLRPYDVVFVDKSVW